MADQKRNIPGRLKFDGDAEVYRLVVLRVEGTYDDLPEVGGKPVPAELTYIDENRIVEIAEDCRFVTAYVPESVFGRREEKRE